MSWGKRTRKFSKGARVLNIGQVIDACQRGGWLFIHHKPYHPSVIWNMSLGQIFCAIERGEMFLAVREPSSWWVFEATLDRPHGFVAKCSEIPKSEVYAKTKIKLLAQCTEKARAHVGQDGICNVRVVIKNELTSFDRLTP